MAPLVAGLLSLLSVSVCGAAKLSELPASAGAGEHAAPVVPADQPLAFGDRLTPLKRLHRPVFLPFPPGALRSSGNFSGVFPPLPPGLRAAGSNFSLPLLLPLPPALRGAGHNGSSPLLNLPPPPPGLFLPANYSTRVARHQLPFLIRPPPGVVFGTPPPHLLNQLNQLKLQRRVGEADVGKVHQRPVGAPLTPASTTLLETPVLTAGFATPAPFVAPETPAPSVAPETPAPYVETPAETPARPTARKPSFLDYFIPSSDGDGATTPPADTTTDGSGIIRVPKLTGADFLRAVRQQLPDPKKPRQGKALFRPRPNSLNIPQSLIPPTNEYLPPPINPPKDEYLPPPPPTPPKDEYLPPPPPTPPKDEYLPPPPPTPPKDEYLPPPPPTPPKDEYLPPPPPTPPQDEYLPPPPPTPPQDEYLPPPPTPPKDEYLPPPPPTPPKDEYLPPPPPTPPQDEYLPPPPSNPIKTNENVVSDELRKMISRHFIQALNQHWSQSRQQAPQPTEAPVKSLTPLNNDYLPPPPPSPPSDQYLPPETAPPQEPVTPPQDEYLPPPPPSVEPPQDEYLPPPPPSVEPPKDEYLPPPPPPSVEPPSDEYLPPPSVEPPKDEYLPPPPPSVVPPQDEYLPPPPPSVEPPSDEYLPPPSVNPPSDEYLPPPSVETPSDEDKPSVPELDFGYLPPPGGRFVPRTSGKTSHFSKRRKFKLSSDGILQRTFDSSSVPTQSEELGDPCSTLLCASNERCQVILACSRGRNSCSHTKRIAECVSRSYPTCHHCRDDEVCVLKKHCAYSEVCPGAMQCMSRSQND